MIGPGPRVHPQQQWERARRKRERQAQVEHVKRRWQPFSYPMQTELHVHLTRFGVNAAEHATSLLERLHQEQQRSSAASLLFHPVPSCSAWSREQLAQRDSWSDLPTVIGEMLFLHYTTFFDRQPHEQAQRDVSSAARVLRLLVADPQADLGAALAEHQSAFGVASMVDVATMAARLSLLLEPAEHQQE